MILKFGFVTGAQLLYGGDAVVAVDAHSTNEMVKGWMNWKPSRKVVYKGTANSSAEISEIFRAANGDTKCVGVITWMHTFLPPKCGYTGWWISKTACFTFTRNTTKKFRGNNGYGLYEPEPERSRRPRIWFHHRPPAQTPQNRCGCGKTRKLIRKSLPGCVFQ